MRDETIIFITGIIAITILEIVNLLTAKIDGNILSAVVGAIVYILTRRYYKGRKYDKA
jgi:energy-converting hydrogenase Eha subunit A